LSGFLLYCRVKQNFNKALSFAWYTVSVVLCPNPAAARVGTSTKAFPVVTTGNAA